MADLLLAGVGWERAGCDLQRREVTDKLLQLCQARVVRVTHAIVASSLKNG